MRRFRFDRKVAVVGHFPMLKRLDESMPREPMIPDSAEATPVLALEEIVVVSESE